MAVQDHGKNSLDILHLLFSFVPAILEVHLHELYDVLAGDLGLKQTSKLAVPKVFGQNLGKHPLETVEVFILADVHGFA